MASEIYLLFIHFVLLLSVYDMTVATEIAPIARPGCQDHCGTVQIPYPFGIGEGCYKNEWFSVQCLNGSAHLLRQTPLKVIEIQFHSNYFSYRFKVELPGISLGCSTAGALNVASVNLTGSPFFISSYNTFVALGCNNNASLTIPDKKLYLECHTTCDDKRDDRGQATLCTNNKCCTTEMPRLQEFTAKIESTDANRGKCLVAYLDYHADYPLNASDRELAWLSKAHFKVGIEWYMDDKEVTNTKAIECMYDGSDNYCRCKLGYAGNPYLPDGCKAMKQSVSLTIKIITLGTGLGFGLLFLSAAMWWSCKAIKKRKQSKLKKKFFERNGGLLLQQQLSSTQGSIDKTKIFSSKELEKATDKFSESRILGQGGQGTVYKGMLIDGRIVAVKKPKEVDKGNLEEFINEVVILSQINHRNIVKLLGCCLETEVPILVYEFIPNGNLFQHLHDQSDDFPMTWEVRLQIATEITGALYYLHSAAAIPIYHRDVKSTNILLDEKYRAKVSDFGTSRSINIDQSHLTTLVAGTVGYVDPEYYQSSQFTDKSDVYSFGVVLVQLLTSEKPVSNLRPQEGRILARYFLHSIEEGKMFDILDAQVLEQCDHEQVQEMANLARRCLRLNGKMWPTMKEVAMELDQIQSSQKALQVEIKNDKEVEAVRTDVISSWNSFYTAPAFDCGASSSLDAESLVPLKTW